MIDIQKLLNEHGGGALLVEVNDTIQKVIKDCCDTEKKGVVTIKFTFEPLRTRDEGHQLKITPAVTAQNPKYDSGVAIFYVVTDENDQPVDLERDDPRQMKLIQSATQEAK